MTTTSTYTSEQLARRAAALASDMKAQDVVILDLRGVTDVADFFVIASGTSDTHVRSIAQHVMEEMDCVVHVFHPALRQYYQLERLWGDAVPLNMTT
jgi:ribosome-associated protein